MKVTLEFELPKDAEEHELAMNGASLSSAMDDYANWLRTKVKYESDDYTAEQLAIFEMCREAFFDRKNGG